MNQKRFTPQSKCPPSTSKYLTPTNLHPPHHGISRSATTMSTMSCTRGLADVSTISRIGPNIKRNLINGTFIDDDLACDLAYSDYLQALMKEELVSNVSENHKRDMKDQLIIQKDNLFKMEMKLKKAREELNEMKMLEEANRLLNCVQNNFHTLFQLKDHFQLEEALEQLLQMLESLSNKVLLRNVEAIKGQENFDRLFLLLKQLMETCDRMKLNERNKDLVNELALAIRKFEEVSKGAIQQQEGIENRQKLETYNLMKSISDMYAEKQKYSN